MCQLSTTAENHSMFGPLFNLDLTQRRKNGRRNTSPQDDNMTAQPGEGSGDLKRPHDMATPDNDTPSKKTLSEAPATPSDSSAVRTSSRKSRQNCSGNKTPARGSENNAGDVASTSSSPTRSFFFLRLPIGQYGPVSQLSRSEERCTGPFNWGEAHCAGEKVKRKIGPFLRKSLKNQTKTRTQQTGAQPATATRNPLARLPGARAKEEKTTTNKRLHKQILVRLNVLDLQWTIL